MCAPVHFSPPSAGGIDDHRSSLALRPHLHKLFDSREFAAAPKYAADDGAPPTLAVHVLIHNRQRELIQLYDNIILQPLSGIATEFLFARFARAIFSLASIFLEGTDRRNLRVTGDGGCQTKMCFSTVGVRDWVWNRRLALADRCWGLGVGQLLLLW
jgi:hypothetical protein